MIRCESVRLRNERHKTPRSQGKTELELTAEAVGHLRVQYIKGILDAETPDQAFQGVLQVRALDTVVNGLREFSDDLLIEEEAEAYAE